MHLFVSTQFLFYTVFVKKSIHVLKCILLSNVWQNTWWWNCCFIFYYILYIGCDNKSVTHVVQLNCLFINKQTAYALDLYSHFTADRNGIRVQM